MRIVKAKKDIQVHFSSRSVAKTPEIKKSRSITEAVKDIATFSYQCGISVPKAKVALINLQEIR